MNRRFRLVERGVGRFLPSLRRDPLSKVPLWVHKSYSHQGHTEIAGLLAMVSGKNAQTTAVDRNGSVQAKLRREVGDGGGFQIAVLCFEPTVSVLTVLVKCLEGGRIQPHIRGIFGKVQESVRPDIGQEFYGVVLGQHPEGWIDVF